jgi:hypothetical protein
VIERSLQFRRDKGIHRRILLRSTRAINRILPESLRTSAGKRSLNDLVRAQQHRLRNRDANLNFQLCAASRADFAPSVALALPGSIA